jgi:subtilisin family serine protease
MRVFLLLFFFWSSTSFAQSNAKNVIVKFKKTSDYSIDYSRGSITTGNLKLSEVIKKAKVKKITSLLPKKRNVNLKKTELIDDIHFFQIDDQADVNKILSDLQETGLFQYVEADFVGSGSGTVAVTPNDTYFNRQWSLVNDGSFNGSAVVNADIDMDLAWQVTTGDSATIICILDSGLKLDHPEFSSRVWTNGAEIAGNGVDDDNNGYIDDINGWDWVNNDNNPTDDHGHGTHVTSIAAANGNNSDGFAGVNWKCKIMVGKIVNSSGFGFYSWWINGIYYAVQNGAKVINMSVGGSAFSQAMQDACDFAFANNVSIFVSMMNTGNNTTFYPAGYSSTVAIGATDVNDHRASFSNSGNHIDLSAPGVLIYGLSHNSNTNFSTAWSGTSQAAPHVAGVASLLYGIKPGLTPTEIKSILQKTAKDQAGNSSEDTAGWDQYMGFGRLNASNALSELLRILPVDIESISASIKHNKVDIIWKTSFEQNASHFEIQKSIDGQHYYQIGSVKVRNIGGLYVFADHQPFSSTNYYRVKGVDNDKKENFSKVVSVKFNSSIKMRVYPNPVGNVINVQVSNQTNILYLVDISGRILRTIPVKRGTVWTEIDISKLSKGVYIIMSGNESVQFIK